MDVNPVIFIGRINENLEGFMLRRLNISKKRQGESLKLENWKFVLDLRRNFRAKIARNCQVWLHRYFNSN